MAKDSPIQFKGTALKIIQAQVRTTEVAVLHAALAELTRTARAGHTTLAALTGGLWGAAPGGCAPSPPQGWGALAADDRQVPGVLDNEGGPGEPSPDDRLV